MVKRAKAFHSAQVFAQPYTRRGRKARNRNL